MEALCSIAECGKPARRSGFCWTHSKRLYESGAVGSSRAHSYVHRDPWERLSIAALEFADVASADCTSRELQLAVQRLGKVAYRWVSHAGKGERR